MLSSKYRLVKQGDFKKIYQKGLRLSGSFFYIYYKINSFDYPRFAVVASSKVSKKAVVRNRLKRQVREIIHQELDKYNSNIDIIINISPKAVDQEFSDLSRDLLTIFKKIKLF